MILYLIRLENEVTWMGREGNRVTSLVSDTQVHILFYKMTPFGFSCGIKSGFVVQGGGGMKDRIFFWFLKFCLQYIINIEGK